jgi:imidazolonepropionase-like amidohydrolase
MWLLWAGSSFRPSFAQVTGGATVAVTGARLIDGTGRPAIESATLLVTDGRVQAVGPSASVQIPAGAARIDGAGKTIIPGLISAHTHSGPGAQLLLYAQYGVTTVYSLGSDGPKEGARNEVAPEHARLFGAPGVRATSVEEARRVVDSKVGPNVHMIKIWVFGDPEPEAAPKQTAPPFGTGEGTSPPDPTPEVYAAMIDQAHKRGLRVVGHMFYERDARAMVAAGMDVMAHNVRDKDIDPAFVAELKRRNVAVIPTLSKEYWAYVYESKPDFFNDPFFLRHADRKLMDVVTAPKFMETVRTSTHTRAAKEALAQASRNVKRLVDGGVRVAMGTDSGVMQQFRWPGYSEQLELEFMAKAGLTPTQVLVAATGDAAKAMKLDGDLGTLQPGKLADFLVLNANPLSDIRNTRLIDAVWIGGRKLANAP